MYKVKQRYKRESKSSLLPLHATLSSSWVPLTLAFLLYTSGIDLSIGEESPPPEEAPEKNVTLVIKNYTKTGNPQIDYVHDPNLPLEVRGLDLSEYPFLSRVPKIINYSCDGLKDGFYANIEHKCQVYHQCSSATRYDFLCANYTAFDQKTFICQYLSEVDCANSALFFHRNDELYWTTTEAPRTYRKDLYDRKKPSQRERETPASGGGDTPVKYLGDKYPAGPPPTPADYDSEYDSEEDYAPVRRKPARRRCKNKRRCRNRRRRPRPRVRPAYYDDDYDEYEEEFEDEDYYEDRPPKRGGRRNKDKLRPQKDGNRVAGSKKIESEITTQSTTTASTTTPPPLQESETLDIEPSIAGKSNEDPTQSEAPPKRWSPTNDRVKYEGPRARKVGQTSTKSTTTTTPTPQVSEAQEVEDYYYDNEEQSQPKTSAKPTPSTKPTTTLSPRQKFRNRNSRPPIASTTAPTTTARTTTTRPTTTTTVPTTTTQRPQRVSVKAFIPQSSTTTTTEAPQYEYEYEYEDEVPVSSSASTESAQIPTTSFRTTTTSTTTPKTTTTLTTTTTTPKPSRNSLRGKRPPFSGGTIQTSTSVSVQETEQEEDDSQNAINRRQSPWNRGAAQRTTFPAALTTAPTPNSISSTSEKQFQRGNRQQQQNYIPQERETTPVVNVKTPQRGSSPSPSQYDYQSSSTSSSVGGEGRATDSVIKTRPSRFWQRPAKVVASSTTTEAPVIAVAGDYDYEQEEPAPVMRYNPSPQKQAPSRFKANIPSSESPPYSNPNTYRGQYTSSSSNSNPNNQQQYLRASTPTQNPYRERSSSNYISQYGPSPSSIGFMYQVPSSTQNSNSRPEFISLLRDDEDDTYYDIPQTQLPNPNPRLSSSSTSSSSSSSSNNNYNNRRIPPPQRTQYFGGASSSGSQFQQTQKNLYSAAQETFQTFLPAPSRYFDSPFVSMFSDFDSSNNRPVYAYRGRSINTNPIEVAMLGGKK